MQIILSVAPSGIPGSIIFSDVNLTSITLQWMELPCSDCNRNITSYRVEYSSTTPPHTYIVTVSGSRMTRLVVGGLLPRTNYTFSVRAQGAAVARNGTSFTATPTGQCNAIINVPTVYVQCTYCSGVGLFFNGRLLSNNSMVLLDDIGENSSALYCLTDRELCCSEESGTDPRGLWFFPNGTVIDNVNSDVYISRGFSSIHLNIRSTARMSAGCEECPENYKRNSCCQ